MARLIDADALKGVFVGEYPGMYTKKYIKNLIDGMPTVEMPGWISVKDRLPEIVDSVLFTGKNAHGGSFRTQRGYFDGTFWHSDSIGTIYAITPVTHWMPLPEPPEEVGGDG